MIALAPLLLLVPALLAGCAVGLRLSRTGARGAVDRTLVAFAVLALPPYALGWLGGFTAGGVGLAVVSTALAIVLGSRIPLARLWPDLRDLVLAPWHVARDAWRRGDRLLPLALAVTAAVLGWTTLLTYLAPSTSWDGMWYHDSMVGFAVQHRGFAWVELPRDATQVINGYPRLIETVAAAFVVTSDATWIELPSILAFPALGAALVTLAQNAAAWPRGNVLFACAFLLSPAIAFELRSTYVDVPIDFLLVTALAAITRPRLRVADLGIAALAVGMLAGAKSTAAVLVPLLAVVALVRTAVAPELGWQRWLPHVAGAALVLLCAAPLYLRNFERTENPFWPLTLEGPFGLAFEGPIEVVVRWPPVELWLREMYGAPMQGLYHPDVRPHGYGHALPFVLPLAVLLALPSATVRVWRFDRVTRVRLLLVVLGVLMALATREVMWWGRFGIVPVIACCAPLLGFFAMPARRTLAVRALVAIVAIHVATLVLGKPGFAHGPRDALDLLASSAAERVATPRSELFVEPRALALREAEIGPGDVVAFGEEIGFLSLLWNHAMNNRVEYVPPSPRWIDELHARDAEWAVTRQGSSNASRLRRAGWTELGPLANGVVAWRRPELTDTEPASEAAASEAETETAPESEPASKTALEAETAPESETEAE